MDTKNQNQQPINEHPEIDKEIDRAVFMLRHGKKVKATIIIIAILLVAGLGYFAFSFFIKPAPECTLDEHCEEGYYCSEEKCQPDPIEKPPADLQIQVDDTYFFDSVKGKVDLLGFVRDPDPSWGVKEMNYTFKVFDAAGNEVGSRTGKSYILPGEEKYLVAVGVPVSGKAASVELEIEPLVWVKALNLQAPEIEIKNISLQEATNLGNMRLDGRLVNSSYYNFEEIEVAAVLLNSAGVPVGTNFTTLNSLFAGEERDFTLIWFSDPVQNVTEEIVVAEANVYDTKNMFLQMQNEPERFQLYQD